MAPVRVDMDRVPLGNERFSLLKLPEDPNAKAPPLVFDSADKAPFRVELTIPQRGLPPTALNVAVIDSYNPLELDLPTGQPGEETIRVRASHLAMVTHVLAREKVHIGAIYDVCSDRKSKEWDIDRMLASVNDLSQRIATERFDAVNISLASHRNIEDFNQVAAVLGLDQITLTADNIQTQKEHVWAILREDARRHGDDCPAAKYLKVATELQKISDAGVPICIGAGNNGASGFNLLAALVPDMIVVGGANGMRLDTGSASTSLNDTMQPMSTTLPTDDEKGIRLEGTSMSTAQATSEVAELKHQGLSVQRINELLRLRMTQRDLKEPTEVILFDLKNFESLANLEKKGALKEALPTLRVVDSNIASTVELLVANDSLPYEKALEFLSSVGKACDTLSLPRAQAQELLKSFAECTAERRTMILADLRKTESSPRPLSEVIEMLKDIQ